MSDSRVNPCPQSENVGSYALGALPEDELRAFEAHLVDCDRCGDEIAGLKVVVDALPSAAPPAVPPSGLKRRLMAVVEAEAELLRASGPAADRPAPPRSRRRLGQGWLAGLRPVLRPLAVAGAVAALAVGVAIGALAVGSNNGSPSTRAISAHVDPALARGADATLRVSADQAKLEVHNLPRPAGDRVYQVWLKHPGRPPSPTHVLFSVPEDGSTTVTVPGRMRDVEQIMVTSEPPGGSRTPTTPPIIFARI